MASFRPVVLLGLGSAALGAVAAAQPWLEAAVSYKLLPGVPEADTRADLPLALAVGLVVLAGWGATLVTRRRLRRVLMAVTGLAALGYACCLVAAPLTLPDDLRDRLQLTDASVGPTHWYLAAIVAGAVSLASTALGIRSVGDWPEMGTRYDAPGSAPGPTATDDPWKALDEGRDPTDPRAP